MSKSRRHKTLIDVQSQVFFGLELAFVSLVFFSLCFLLFFIPGLNFYVEGEEATEWILDAFGRMIILKWPLVIVAFLMTWALGVVMSRRLAGPMFQIDQVIKAWKEGDYKTRLQFRKHDYIVPIMKPINELLDEQEQVMTKAQALVQELQNTSGDPEVLKKTRELLKVLYKK